MRAVTKITLLDRNEEKFFGEGPCRLLRAIEATGSLRSAAAEMGMAYTKALKLLKNAEQELGYPLTRRVIGGKNGGGSLLTPEGLAFLTAYEGYRAECLRQNQALFRQYFPTIACVIMAAGESRRFGSIKLLEPFQGQPMILRALEATEGLFTRRALITRHIAVAELCVNRGAEVVLHTMPKRSDTIRTGLETIGDADCCLFLPGDQPLLRRDTIAAMVESWKHNRDKIHRAAWQDTPGAPVLFPSRYFPELMALRGEEGGGKVMACHPSQILCVQAGHPEELTDADTPEVFARLERMARND